MKLAWVRTSLSFVFNRRLSYTGRIFGAVLYCLSLTPSLLPRTWMIQGILSGITITIGYAIGVLAEYIWNYLQLPKLRKPQAHQTKHIIGILTGITVVIFVAMSISWQNNIRQLLDMQNIQHTYLFGSVLLSFLMAIFLLIISRMVLGLIKLTTKFIDRFAPPRASRVIGVSLSAVIVFNLVNGVLVSFFFDSLNSAYSLRNGRTKEGIVQPTSSFRSGSPDSLSSWDTLGIQGREFVASGPTIEELQAFNGEPAQEPIRVYVGLEVGDVEARAELALQELVRTNAFDREIMLVATATGTGWVDPNASSTFEYIYNGDSAIVTAQYSYLPSWVSILSDQEKSRQISIAVFEKIHEYWSELDPDRRPKLYLYGLSLGSYGSEAAAQSVQIYNDPIDGALWAGPVFANDIWSRNTNSRDEGSPDWLPVVQDGRTVRFSGEENAFDDLPVEWGNYRIAYLQHPTDPVTFFSPGLAFNEPDWLGPNRGPDVSSIIDWYPIITFWQVAFDFPMAGSVPYGHGHAYAPSSYIDAWVELTEPESWTDQKTSELKQIFTD